MEVSYILRSMLPPIQYIPRLELPELVGNHSSSSGAEADSKDF